MGVIKHTYEEVIDELTKRKVIEPVFWIGTNRRCNLHVHDLEYGSFSGYQFTGAGLRFQTAMTPHLAKFEEFQIRNYHPGFQNIERSRSFLDTLDSFRIMVDYFADIIARHDIELIIKFAVLPSGSDFVLHKISEELNIPLVYPITPSPFNYFFLSMQPKRT